MKTFEAQVFRAILAPAQALYRSSPPWINYQSIGSGRSGIKEAGQGMHKLILRSILLLIGCRMTEAVRCWLFGDNRLASDVKLE